MGHCLALMLFTSFLSMAAYGHLRGANAATGTTTVTDGGTTSTITVAGNINAGDDDIEVYAGTGVDHFKPCACGQHRDWAGQSHLAPVG